MKKITILSLFFLIIFHLADGQVHSLTNPAGIQQLVTRRAIPSTDTSFTVSNIFNNNMVIQRDKPLLIWGRAAPGDKILIKVSWRHHLIITAADSANNWTAIVPAESAKITAQSIECFDQYQKAAICYYNILIGDVWIASGQSNMVMPMAPLPPSFSGVTDFAQEINSAVFTQIRFATLTGAPSNQMQDSLLRKASWNLCDPSTVASVSAVGYYFARRLNTELHVPIGLIIAAVNGSGCENWTSTTAVKANQFLKKYFQPGVGFYFNSYIKPIEKLRIRGFIWYQGESNRTNQPDNFSEASKTLIKDWRSGFGEDDLPFYFVQLTPFDENRTNNYWLNDYAKIREAQTRVLSLPNTGMAVTMDVGDVNNHHPREKKQVGERLALLALNRTYKRHNIICLGPKFKSFHQNDSTVIVNFTRKTASGLRTIDDKPITQHFTIEGADCRFRSATATINNDKIVLTIPAGTPKPIQAVRYAFTNFPLVNLQNESGLPMEPFRSDNFWDQ